MDSLGRLLLRFVLVPLGYIVAVLAGTLVILVGSWKIGLAVTANADAPTVATFGFLFAAPVLLVILLNVMWLPASISSTRISIFPISPPTRRKRSAGSCASESRSLMS